MWELDPTSMRAAVARHDALVVGAIESHHGVVVRSRGEGDSWFGVFTRASDAVMAAFAIQRAMATERWATPAPLKVRIAVHTGETELREGDYYGPEVNRAARLRSLADGGQTLVSESTANLVRRSLPRELVLQPLGPHRLRDIQQPEHVFELRHAGGDRQAFRRAFAAIIGLARLPHLKGAFVAGAVIVVLIFVVIIVTSSLERTPQPPVSPARPYVVLSTSEAVAAHPEGLQLRLSGSTTVIHEGEPVRLALHLRNTKPDPIRVSFPTEQILDFIVRGVRGPHAGLDLYRWSDGRVFGASRRIVGWNPGEDRVLEVAWTPPRLVGPAVQAGVVYRLLAVLESDKPIETFIDAHVEKR
ncbi:MAG: BsuPI-related putative proteinase inhibitor [Armatimonadota bacterium]|nr:BsuPI-related putative proteinase inhibitor [Armatimonadota bacterium]